MTKSKPPMKPSRDINTATQSEIGSFNDDKASKKIVLTDEDQKTYEKWEFISKRSFQEEIVDFYIHEEKVVRFISKCSIFLRCQILSNMFSFHPFTGAD